MPGTSEYGYDAGTVGAGPGTDDDAMGGAGGGMPGPRYTKPTAEVTGAGLPSEVQAGLDAYRQAMESPQEIVDQAEADRAQTVRPAVVRRGPPPVVVPREYMDRELAGGHMFPPDYVTRFAAEVPAGNLTRPQADKLTEMGRRWEASPEGQFIGLERARADAEAEQGDFMRQRMERDAQRYGDIANRMGQAQQRVDYQAEQAAMRRQRLMADYESQMDKYRAAVDEVKTAKIDPNRYWKNQNTGMRILGAIAMGLGAVGETVGIKNHAAEIISKAVDADIAAQQANIDNQRQGLGAQQGILAFMRERIGDSDQAAEAARAQIYQNLASYVEQQAAQTESALLKNKAGALVQALKAKQVLSEKELGLRAATWAQQAELARMQSNAAASAQRQKEQERLRRMQTLAEGGFVWSDAGPDDVKTYAERAGGFAPDQETRKALDALYAASDDLLMTLGDLEKIARSGSKLSLEDRAVAEQKQNEAVLKLKEMYAMGALDKGALQVGLAIVPNPTSLSSVTGQERLNSIRDSIKRGRALKARSMGIRPGAMLPGFDKDGNQIMRRGVLMPGRERMEQRIRAAQEAAYGTAPDDRVNSAFKPE